MDLNTAIALAAYSIFRVKDIASGVGKNTHVIWVGKDGLPCDLQADQIYGREQFFKFDRDLEAMLIHRALGNDDAFAGIERIETLVEHVRGKVKELVHVIAAALSSLT